MTSNIMAEKIVARVKLGEDGPIVIVRKTDFNEDGTVNKKYGLSREGNWIEVPERNPYPCECYLAVALYDKRDSSQIVRESSS